MEELNLTVKAIQDKVSIMETEIASVQDRQRTLDRKFSHMKKNAEFVDEQIIELKMALQASTDERKDEISECRKQVLYLEVYSRRENLKFEGIPELVEVTVQQNVTSHEDTKNVLANFMENVLGIEDAKDIEFQRVHRMGMRLGSNGRVKTCWKTVCLIFLIWMFSWKNFSSYCSVKVEQGSYPLIVLWIPRQNQRNLENVTILTLPKANETKKVTTTLFYLL